MYAHTASVLKTWIEREYGADKAPQHFSIDEVDSQQNGVDCGVFAGRGMAGKIVGDDQMVSQAFCDAHRLTIMLTNVRGYMVLIPGNMLLAPIPCRISS